METFIFDGKRKAVDILEKLKMRVFRLHGKNIKPRLASIMIGDDEGSKLYLVIKKRAAEKIGAEVEIAVFNKDTLIKQIISFIKKLNLNPKIHGIMVQLPLPGNFSPQDESQIINAINKEKDIDGMRNDSPFLTPVVMAIGKAVDEAKTKMKFSLRRVKMVILGASGFVGSKTAKYFKEENYNIIGCNSEVKKLEVESQKADILICATGHPGLIGGGDIQKGVIIIDVGAPKGDVRVQEILGKAAFLSPVPGGIGPLTVSCLMENLVSSAESLL